MDAIDRQILGVLSEEGRISATELSARISLGTSATTERLRRLTRSSVIRRFTVELDPAAAGRPITAFVDLRLRRDVDKATADARLPDLDAIVDARHVTGRYDYELRVAAVDIDDIDRLLERLRDEVGADETVTRLVLRTVDGFPRQPRIAPGA